jgi:hypothetical protein
MSQGRKETGNKMQKPPKPAFKDKVSYTLKEASAITGLSVKTLRRRVASGVLKRCSKINEKIIISKEALEEWRNGSKQ